MPNPRTAILSQRNQLSADELDNSTQLMSAIFQQSRIFLSARNIAAFIAIGNEQSPRHICAAAWQLGKNISVPALRPFDKKLWFVPYTRQSILAPNKFGILEPQAKQHKVPPWSFDIVLTPLVAFDNQGNRLGMGGGFYDRTFAFSKRVRKKPKLIGIAHALQQIDHIDAQPWDIPLDALVTEKELIIF